MRNELALEFTLYLKAKERSPWIFWIQVKEDRQCLGRQSPLPCSEVVIRQEVVLFCQVARAPTRSCSWLVRRVQLGTPCYASEAHMPPTSLLLSVGELPPWFPG